MLHRKPTTRRPVELPSTPAVTRAAESLAQPAPATASPPGLAERLAASSGGTLTHEPTGETAVVFPTPGIAAAAPTLTRAAGPSAQARPTLARRTLSPAAPDASALAPPHEAQRDREELYEDLYDSFIERLRRDLLHERERSGHLVDDLF
jgi:hypothetical protein